MNTELECVREGDGHNFAASGSGDNGSGNTLLSGSGSASGSGDHSTGGSRHRCRHNDEKKCFPTDVSFDEAQEFCHDLNAGATTAFNNRHPRDPRFIENV